MSIVSVYRAKARGWEDSFSYGRMKYNPNKPLENGLDYRKSWEKYVRVYVRLQQTIGAGFLNDRQALIIGPGRDPIEAGLLFGSFPRIARLHVLDWQKENVDGLEVTLTQWSEQYPQYGRTKLYLSDAANMEDISAGSIHLVQVNNVLQHIEGPVGQPPQKVIDILREFRRVLAPEGYLFILGKAPSELLRRSGFAKVGAGIWRRAA